MLPRDWVVAPETLPWKLRVEERIEPALEGADVVMALRLQLERQHSGLIPSIREYCKLYALNSERLALAQPGAVVMHPGPMNEGVEIAPDVAHGAQSVIEEQESRLRSKGARDGDPLLFAATQLIGHAIDISRTQLDRLQQAGHCLISRSL